jgi:hypothetical protein
MKVSKERNESRHPGIKDAEIPFFSEKSLAYQAVLADNDIVKRYVIFFFRKIT